MRPAVYMVVVAFCLRGVFAAEPVQVSVTLPPLAYVAEAIGGACVQVECLLRPGDNPHTYEPTPQQVQALASADMLLTAAGMFEQRVSRQLAEQQRSVRIVDVAQGVASIAHEHAGHAHEPAADPHIWLSPAALERVARTVAKALSETDPVHTAEYEKNLDALLARIGEVDGRIRGRLAPYRGRAFFVYHGAFAYFAEAYELRQVAVETEGKAPAPRRIQALVEQAKAGRVRTVFIEPQFDPAAADVLAKAIGANVAQLDPLKKDVLNNLEAIAAALAESFAHE